MERKIKNRVVGIVVVMLMLAQVIRAGKYYYCWGGCLNQCILATSKAPADKFPCYMNCVNSCVNQPTSVVPRPPSVSPPPEIPFQASSAASRPQYYCWLGCSLETCMLVSRDAAELKTCLSSCTTLCKP